MFPLSNIWVSGSISDRIDNWLYGEYQNRMNYFKGLIAEDLKDAVEFRKVGQLNVEFAMCWSISWLNIHSIT